MALWASTAGVGSTVQFLMVCVELGSNGLRTAQAFGQQFQLPAAVLNGYVEQKCDLPSYGQLGCQGFVVIGPHGEFAMRRTVPCYLAEGQKAFEAVEKLFSQLWNIQFQAALAQKPMAASASVLKSTSVGVPEMDEEHKAIWNAVADVQRNQNRETMQSLLSLWREHSEHEEQLFEKFDFGQHRSAGAGFAATGPHCEHHRHIASMMEDYITGQSAAANQIDLVATEIQRHAEIYDAAYAGKLQAESETSMTSCSSC